MKTKTLFLILFATMIADGLSAQQAGDLDSTFGVNGLVRADLYSLEITNENASSVAIAPDGKIVIAGGMSYSTGGGFALARFDSDGTFDNNFNIRIISFPDSIRGEFSAASSLAIQPDGRIIVAGTTDIGGFSDFALARLNSQGVLDTTFGNGGVVFTDFNMGIGDRANGLVLQSDGKIIVAGGSSYDGISQSIALARYNTNGSLDSSFGIGGKIIASIDTNSCEAISIALQSDGKIIAGGYSLVDAIWPYKEDLALARFNTNGSLDSTFSTNGILINSRINSASSIAIQSDGKIVVTGPSSDSSKSYFALARYNGNGALDTLFGLGGIAITDFGGNGAVANSLIIQPDGKIIAAGYYSNGTDFDFALAQYNPDGRLDTTFGIGGKITTAFGRDDVINAITTQQDGKIIAAGYSSINARPPNQGGYDHDFALARYLSSFNVGIVEFSQSENNVLIYPNPIGQNATLEYTLVQEETITIRLLDMQGKTIQTFIENIKKESGNHQQSITLPAALPAGSYLIVIESAQGKMGIKVVK